MFRVSGSDQPSFFHFMFLTLHVKLIGNRIEKVIHFCEFSIVICVAPHQLENSITESIVSISKAKFVKHWSSNWKSQDLVFTFSFL